MNLVLTTKDFDLFSKSLFPLEVVILKLLFTKNEELYKKLYNSYGEVLMLGHLKCLEERQYIKLLNVKEINEIDTIAVRTKTEELFKEESDNVEEVIDYLNKKLNKKRGYNSKGSNRRFITGRLAEGYSVNDLKAVIDLKVKEWLGTGMEEYLRPETLFNATKFQGYIVQTESNKTKMNIYKTSNE